MSRLQLSGAALLLPLLLWPATGQFLCYYPSGQQSRDVPCNISAPVSMCCGSTKACLSNGLCAMDDTTSGNGTSYARGTCTDRSWTSGVCPQRCILNQDTPDNSSAYDFRSNGVQVWECDKEGFGVAAEYCCESASEKTRCCNTATAVFQLPAATIGNALNQTIATTTSTSSTSKTTSTTTSKTTSTSTSTTISRSTSTSNSASSTSLAGSAGGGLTAAAVVSDVSEVSGALTVISTRVTGIAVATDAAGASGSSSTGGLSTAAQAGIGVGVGAVVVSLAAAAYFRRRQTRKKAAMGLGRNGEQELDGEHIYEMDGTGVMAEAPGTELSEKGTPMKETPIICEGGTCNKLRISGA